jgi:hypothetical protein
MNKEVTPIQIALRIVIIIILIVVLLLVSFALVRFVPKIVTSFSSFRDLFGAKERLVVALDQKTITLGDSANLSVKQTGGKGGGQYVLSYSCAKIDSRTSLKINTEDESEVIGCDKSFILPIAPSSTTSEIFNLEPRGDIKSYEQPVTITVKHVTASSTIASTASVILTISGEKDAAEDDEVKEEVKEETVATSTLRFGPKPVEDKPVVKTPAPAPVKVSTPADLTVSIGSLNVDNNGKATLTFYVTNKGGSNSGSWTFSSTLPRDGQTVYNSPSQSSIPPGGTSTMYLTFYNAHSGNVTVTIDPNNNIKESNENNNYTSATLR